MTTEVQFYGPAWCWQQGEHASVEARTVGVSTEAGDTLTLDPGPDAESVCDSRHNFWAKVDGRWEAVGAQALARGIDSVTVTRAARMSGRGRP